MSNSPVFDLKLPEKKKIGLAVCCDWHRGSHTCNESAIDRWIKLIKDNGWYVILLGDLTENSLPGSVGDVLRQTMSPDVQVRTTIEKLSPIRDYIIAGCDGNHGARTVRVAGMNPDEQISSGLGVPHFSNIIRGRIKVGVANWKVIGHHCAGGGALMGSKLNVIKKLALIDPMYDLYLGAHTHGDVSGSDVVYGLSLNGKPKVTKLTRHFSGCGSTLAYEDSYAEAKMLAPAAMCQVVHHLFDKVHRLEDGAAAEAYYMPYIREPYWLGG